MTLPNKPYIAVLWDDAHSPEATDVYSESGIPHSSTPIVTAGWELRNDDTGISLACEYVGDQQYRGLTFIPRTLVRTVTVLKKAKKTK